jgi:hypothetical protein
MSPKLLDLVRQTIRLRHYSRRTEDAYRPCLAASDVSAFLTWLAGHERVSASTQNQALSASCSSTVRLLQSRQELLPGRRVPEEAHRGL